jgi:hypothetical protein
MENVAHNHLSAGVDASPETVDFDHGEAFEMALKLESILKLGCNLPCAVAVFVAVQFGAGLHAKGLSISCQDEK